MKKILSYLGKFFSKLLTKSLDYIEIIGNKLPHPVSIFAILACLVVLASFLGYLLDVRAIHPVDNREIKVFNLLSAEGFRWIYTNIIKNFLSFPPLGYVLVVVVGIGVAEGSGLFPLLIRALVIKSPPQLITSAVVLAGVFSIVASEIGYVVLIPLGAMIFHALGRHPIAGLAAAFCGVSGGFGSGLVIGTIDPILAGISESAAQMINPNITINPTVNYFFMIASSILIIILGTFITEKIVEPRLGKYEGNVERPQLEKITAKEKKGLKWAAVGFIVSVFVILLTIVPSKGIFRNPETGSVLESPFFKGIIICVLVLFFIPGLIYGIVVGTIKNDKDIVKHITKSMSNMAGYITLVFFASQFVYFFNHSNLGIIFAIKGANFLKQTGFTGPLLIAAFVLLSAIINLFMGSASAKWAILAPIFVPMFMLIDPPFHPALTQAAFRIGDSVTNVITPMMSYFALIVSFAQRYDEKYGIGTIVSTMLPYTVTFFIFWTALLVIWMLLGLPLGPGGYIYLN